MLRYFTTQVIRNHIIDGLDLIDIISLNGLQRFNFKLRLGRCSLAAHQLNAAGVAFLLA